LDAVELARSLDPFGTSRMLPKAAYLDPDVFSWEQANVFAGWICLGRASEIPTNGSMKAFAGADAGILVTRDKVVVLHGFENACRHRGHELLHCGGSAEARAIICPYHAWTYDFDGSLRGAPGFKDVEGFDRSGLGLNAVPVREWHGWVFADPSGDDSDFVAHIGELEAIIAPYDAASLQTAETHQYEVAANWKVIIENYQECYHCSMIHPELCRVSPPESGENLEREGDWVGGWMELRSSAATMSLDGHSGGVAMARLDEEEQRTVMYIAVMPNLLISLHPDYVMTHLLTPLSPERTSITCSWAFPPQAMDREGFDPAYAVDFWDLTNRQDWSACESVQRGMHARRYQPGPLAPAEDGVYHFVTAMARTYLGTTTD
ncbi:MAG: glycine betaine catabolism, partial [Nocardioidaceae bacterium]|nr:glycine betaine catabolism [Nocardioidaceae bacterium]